MPENKQQPLQRNHSSFHSVKNKQTTENLFKTIMTIVLWERIREVLLLEFLLKNLQLQQKLKKGFCCEVVHNTY